MDPTIERITHSTARALLGLAVRTSAFAIPVVLSMMICMRMFPPQNTVNSTFHTGNIIVDNTQNIGGTFTSTAPGTFDPEFNQLAAMKLAGEMNMLLNSTGSDGNDVQLFMKYNATNRVGETININNFIQGTFDTTASSIQAIGVQSIMQGVRGTGSNNLANVAIDASATGGDDNYSFFGHKGFLRNDGDASLFNTTVGSLTAGIGSGSSGQFVDLTAAIGGVSFGNFVRSFVMPGTGGVTTSIGIGTTHTDGTQIQTKNTDAAAGITGIDIGADTTLASGIVGGLFLYRGAGGGIGGGTESVVAIDSGGRLLDTAVAGDMVVASETFGKHLLFSADGAGFTTGATMDGSGDYAIKGVFRHNGLATGQVITGGSGDPTGAVNCNNGDLFTRTDGSTSTTLYVCTGSNTWTAK